MAIQTYQKSVTLTIGAEIIKQSISTRNLGGRLEPDLTMLPHINGTCRSDYYHLWRINKIRKYLSDCGAKHWFRLWWLSAWTIVIVYTMDYQWNHWINSTSINAAARVITKAKIRDHISSILRYLHWLPIKKRTDNKMMVRAFKALKF